MGKFYKNSDGDIIHVNSPDIMTKERIEWWEKNEGMKMICKICGNPVDEGGQKDCYWPYFDDMNRCKACLEKERGKGNE